MRNLPLTGDSSVSAVIDEFVDTAGSDAGRRELRAALSHVDAEFGTKPMRAVRPRHVTALLDELYDAGLSTRRESAILDALRELYAFALARGIVATDPTPRPERTATTRPPRPERTATTRPPRPERTATTRLPRSVRTATTRTRRAVPTPTYEPESAPSPTPTLSMFALGARVAVWTAWTVTMVFVALLVALIVEFA